jgi:CheY-like chemotaxis protein
MPKTLLLADDSVTIQKVVGISFANEDVRIVTVDNGDDAVLRAREIRPDIVLADVVMPGKSGYEVCAALKADPALAGIPVLLLTGTFETFDEERAARVGADGHITKPFEAQALVALVNARLASAGKARPASAASASEPEPFDFLEPEPTTARRSKAGTARPVASLSSSGFAFDDDALETVDLEAEDDSDLGNEATAARTTLLLDEAEEEAFADAETEPPAALRPVGTSALERDDPNELTQLVLRADSAAASIEDAFAGTGDPLAGIDSISADPFADSPGRAEWDVSSDELPDSFSTRVLAEPAVERAAVGDSDLVPEPFVEPLFDDDTAAEFDLAADAPPAAPERVPAAERPSAAVPELSEGMRSQLHDTLEKIAWEALGDVSERIVREAVARIEQVAWDVLPRLAETLIREEIRKLKGED